MYIYSNVDVGICIDFLVVVSAVDITFTLIFVLRDCNLKN